MATRKKQIKNSNNKETKSEKNIQLLEKRIEKLEKILEDKQEELSITQKEEVEEKIETIREDLKTQLLNQNKIGKQFDDMVEDYIFLVKLKEKLQYDIALKGIRYAGMTGNGYITSKPNESVVNLLKVNAQMLKILQDLELKAPEDGPKEGEGDDLL